MSNNRKLTYELCKEVASKFKHISELQRADFNVYGKILKMGWNELLSDYILLTKPNGYWGYERCKESALLCESKSEFKKRFPSAIKPSKVNGWWDEITSHMGRKKPGPIYDIETISDEIKKYKSREELIEENLSLMNFIYSRKLTSTLNKLLPTKVTENKNLKKEGKKRCSRCNNVFDLDNFDLCSKNNPPKGYRPTCKKCFTEKNVETHLKRREEKLITGGRVELQRLLAEGKKRCTICKEIKQVDKNFYFNKSKNIHIAQCNDCVREKNGYKKSKYELSQEYLDAVELSKDGLKKCTVCLEIKPFDEFGKHKKSRFGLTWNCRSCKSKQDKEYRDNPIRRRELLDKKSEYYHKVKNDEWFKNYQKNRVRDYKKETSSLKSNPTRLIKSKLRKITCGAFARRNKDWVKKGTKTENLLGADFFVVKEFIERQFLSGMTWDNYGIEWNIDHVIPLDAAGDDVEMINRLCFYQNLSPAWVKVNYSKGFKIPEICTLWENPIVPYKERDIVITPRYDGIVGRYKLIIEPGERYGNLTVIEEVEGRIGKTGVLKRIIKCKCDCGNEKDILLNSLRQGNTTSCGCTRKERMREFFVNKKTLIFTDEEIKILTNHALENEKRVKYTDEFINSFPGRSIQQIRRYVSDIRKGTTPLKVKNPYI
jgi:hypothetical protein